MTDYASAKLHADTARYEALLTQHPLAPEHSIPDGLRAHLLRDIGPAAFADGGDLFLMMPSMKSMARGGAAAETAPRLRVVGG